MTDSRSGDTFRAREPTAVDHAFSVLEQVAETGPGVTARELVASLPLSKATVYRIIKHLVEQEYLMRTPDLTGFALGKRVLGLLDSAQRAPVVLARHPDTGAKPGDGNRPVTDPGLEVT